MNVVVDTVGVGVEGVVVVVVVVSTVVWDEVAVVADEESSVCVTLTAGGITW